MNNGSLVSESDLGSDLGSDQLPFETINTSPTGLTALTANQQVNENGGNGSSELRAAVSRRFMSMLRAHDRARLKLLSGNPGPGKANC
jgi:hypothetical protein